MIGTLTSMGGKRGTMKAERGTKAAAHGTRSRHAKLSTRSASRIPRSAFACHAACWTPPPMYTLTGALGGPLISRGDFQNATRYACVPGAIDGGSSISKLVRVDSPIVVHAVTSVGNGSGPAYMHTLQP